jgi:hypothetical protein
MTIAAASLLVTAATASAHDRSGHSEGHGRTALYSFDWQVSRDSDGRVQGYFTAKATSPADVLVAPQGPATCVDFVGNKVGFLYPIQDNSRPAVAKGQYVLITGEDNGGKGRDRTGFVGPAPKEFFHGCQPDAAPLAVDGRVHVDDREQTPGD